MYVIKTHSKYKEKKTDIYLIPLVYLLYPLQCSSGNVKIDYGLAINCHLYISLLYIAPKKDHSLEIQISAQFLTEPHDPMALREYRWVGIILLFFVLRELLFSGRIFSALFNNYRCKASNSFQQSEEVMTKISV